MTKELDELERKVDGMIKEIHDHKKKKIKNFLLVTGACAVVGLSGLAIYLNYQEDVLSQHQQETVEKELVVEKPLEKKLIVKDTVATLPEGMKEIFNTKTAEEYYLSGNELFTKTNYSESIKDYTEAINLDSQFSDAYYLRSVANIMVKNFDSGINDFEKGKEINLNETLIEQYKSYFSDAYFQRGKTHAKENSLDKALSDFKQALDLQPNSLTYSLRGDIFLKRNDFSKAVNEYNLALNLDASNKIALMGKIASQLELGKLFPALDNYEKALQFYSDDKSPDFVFFLEFKHFLGAIGYYGSETKEKIKSEKYFIPLRTKFTQAYYQRGKKREIAQNLESAIDDYSKAIEMGPEFGDAHFSRSLIRLNSNDFDGAISDYENGKKLPLKDHPSDSLEVVIAGAYYGKAISLANEKKYGQAIENFNENIRRRPGHPEDVFFQRAKIRFENKEYHKAITEIDQAFNSGNYVPGYAYLIRGKAKFELGSLEEAITDFERGRASYSYNDNSVFKNLYQSELGNAYLQRSLQNIQKGYLDQAKEDYNGGLALSPHDSLVSRVKKNLGKVYFEQGVAYADGNEGLDRNNKAVELFDLAIEFDPNNADAYYWRGAAACRSGYAASTDMTVSNYETGQRLDPNNLLAKRFSKEYAQGFYFKGQHSLEANNYREAIKYLSTAISFGSEWDSLSYSLRGRAFFFTDKYDKAISDLNEYIRTSPKKEDGYYFRGRAWYAKGNLDKSFKDFNEAIRLCDSSYGCKFDSNMYFFRGHVNFDRNNFDDASSDYTEAINIEARQGYISITGYYWRGRSSFSNYKFEEAADDFSQVINTSKDNTFKSEAYFYRGESYRIRNDLTSAVDNYSSAIGLNPNYGEAYYQRAMAWDKKGEEEIAKKDFAKAKELGFTK